MGEVALGLFVYSIALKLLILAMAICSNSVSNSELKAGDYWRKQKIINLKEVI